MHLLGVLRQHLAGALVGLLDEARDLEVDAVRRLGRVIALGGDVAAQEDLVVGLAVHLGPKLLAHAVAHNHAAGHLRGALDVVGGAGGDVVAEELLGGAAAQHHGKAVEHGVARLQEVVLVGHRKRVTQSLAAGDDADLLDRVGVGEHVAHKRVARLVVGDGLALGVGHNAALARRAGDATLHRLGDLVHADALMAAAGGEKGALVHEVAQVGAGEAGRELSDAGKVDVGREGLVARVDAQDGLAALHVGTVHRDLAVEAAGAQKSRVKDVGAVRGGHEDDALMLLEAVHLNEQLVQGLLALVVTAAHARAALAAHGVDLIDEDDGRSLLLGLGEQVAHTGGAHADEHLDEARTGDLEERHASLASHSLGKQRLAGAGRAHKQHAVRDLGAEVLVLRRVVEVVLDLLELLDGLVATSDVVEADLGTGGVGRLGLRLAEAHGTARGVGELVHEVHHDADEDEHRQHARKQGDPGGRRGDVGHVLDLGVGSHEFGQRVGAQVGRSEGHEGVLIADLVGLGPVLALDGVGHRNVGRLADLAVLDGAHELARGELHRVLVGLTLHGAAHGHHDNHEDERIQQDAAPVGLARTSVFVGRAVDGIEELLHLRATFFLALVALCVGLAGVYRLAGLLLVVVLFTHLVTPCCRTGRPCWSDRPAEVLTLNELRLEHADIGQVAVLLVVIEAIAHHELVGALETHVARVDGSSAALAQKRRHFEGTHAARLQVGRQIAQGQARIENVLDDDDVAVLDLGVEVLHDAQDARGTRGRTVAGDGHVVDLDGQVDGAHQVASKRRGTTQDADDKRRHVVVGVVGRDLGTKLSHTLAELLGGEQDVIDIVGHVVRQGIPLIVRRQGKSYRSAGLYMNKR